MRYKRITITAPDADLSDVLVRIKLDADTDIGAVCQQNGYDVYFTTSDGSVRLPFARLEWSVTDGAASGQFDVLCDIPVSGVTIRMCYGDIASTDPQNRDVTYADYYCVVPTRLSNIVDGRYQDVTGNTSGFNAYTRGVEDGDFPFGSTIRTETGQDNIYCKIGQHDNVEFQSLFQATPSHNIIIARYGQSVMMSPAMPIVRIRSGDTILSTQYVSNGVPNFLANYVDSSGFVFTCADKNIRVAGSYNFDLSDASLIDMFFRSGDDFAEFRAKKTLSSKEMLRFQYFNLTEHENVYTIKKPSKRRRRSAIIDFI